MVSPRPAARLLDATLAPQIRDGDYVFDSAGNAVASSPTLERVLFLLGTKRGSFLTIGGDALGNGAFGVLIHTTNIEVVVRDAVVRALVTEIASGRISNVAVTATPYAQNNSTDVNQYMVTYRANGA
jgi:hypothetical protein